MLASDVEVFRQIWVWRMRLGLFKCMSAGAAIHQAGRLRESSSFFKLKSGFTVANGFIYEWDFLLGYLESSGKK